MGDRSLTTFKDQHGYSPVIYMHWHGSDTRDFLAKAGPILRKGDNTYAAARFCGFCHTEIDSNLGLGLFEPPDPDEEGFDWDEFSHGDAGVFIVDIETGHVEVKGGYDNTPFEINLWDG